MELRAKVHYSCPQFSLNPGDCTADLSVVVTEEKKLQMKTDFPDLFEVIEDKALASKEEELTIETQEAKLKIRKK